MNTRFGLVPPLGPFLNPFTGIWAHSSSSFFKTDAPSETLNLKGLKSKVRVHVDHDQVKHIFAENDQDLYFTQGFVVASDRLWQMEFIYRMASGRLSEVFGRQTLEMDRFFVKMGLSESAQESAKLMLSDDLTRLALTSYAKGVNAYIAQLTPETLPFEYKVLGYKPEEWTPDRAAYLLKFMAYMLSGHSRDLALTRVSSRFDPVDFEDLYSLKNMFREPIVPAGTVWPFEPRAGEGPENHFQARIQEIGDYPSPHPANGSNNWAVSGQKSKTGLPILSNDVHLGLSLPAIWYEVQLISPKQNVYGVTIPGAPGVVLGFNQNLAWAVTNGGADVMDWYELRYRDEGRNEYLFDGNWRPVIAREVKIKVRDGDEETLAFRRTHFGPVVYDEEEEPLSPQVPKGMAMRWASLDPSNELRTFLLLNRAKTTELCRKAIEIYETPNQNFLCADNSNDVGLWHAGKIPIRWHGQGRLVSNGSSSIYEWRGWIPREELPFVRNPKSGFVSSANQAPVDGGYPHYLGAGYAPPFRAMRINEILRSQAKFGPEDFVRMQTDTVAVPARSVLPVLLKSIERHGDLGERDKQALAYLKEWDYRFEEDSVAATIFFTWFEQLNKKIWRAHLPDTEPSLKPPLVRVVDLILNDPESKWFDDLETPFQETLPDVAFITLQEALNELETKAKTTNLAKWQWANVHPTEFEHFGHMPGLGESDIRVRGMASTIFANNDGSHGPVWKLVVALDKKKPRAWGIYPGGQSGDPTSPFYSNFLEAWRNGKMRELNYLISEDDKNPQRMTVWTLEKNNES